MMLSREQYSYMTDYIKRQYAYSADWCKKVNKMPDSQVFAIFCSMQSRQNKQKLNMETTPVKRKTNHTDEQLTIWDLIKKGDSA